MNDLTSRYATRGLQVLGFPCNQFGYQENFGNADIMNVLKYIKPGNNFVPSFPLFAKMDVNGDTADIIFQWLRQQLPYPSDDPTGPFIQAQVDVFWKPVSRTDIGWNFEKFLIGRDGRPYKRYGEPIQSIALIPDIEKLLAQPDSFTSTPASPSTSTPTSASAST